MVKASPISGANPFQAFLILGSFFIGIIELVRSGSHTIIGISFCLYCCLMVLAFIWQSRTTAKLDQRRQRAASGDQSLLASEQITPDQARLSLPTTLRMRHRWLGISIITALFMAFLLLVLCISFLISQGVTGIFNGQRFPLFLLVSLPVIILPIAAMLFAFFLRSKRKIEITVDGLRVNDGGAVHYVPWNEARLFAIYMGKKDTPPTYFELSSSKDIVRWGWSQKFSKFSAEIPIVPVDEYNRQMQPLLSLIVAKTDLPLYDLR